METAGQAEKIIYKAGLKNIIWVKRKWCDDRRKDVAVESNAILRNNLKEEKQRGGNIRKKYTKCLGGVFKKHLVILLKYLKKISEMLACVCEVLRSLAVY